MTNGKNIDVKFGNLDEIFVSTDVILLEQLLEQAHTITRQYFGNTISLYAPIYISNFCENNCRYCGFQSPLKLKRKKLTKEEIAHECKIISQRGLQSLLILTGESRHHSPPEYIEGAIKIAKKYFPYIALEVYALSEEEYKRMYLAGADGITLYQETYDPNRYDELHVSGPKKDFTYRFDAPERMAKAGIRQISMGILLGLSAWRDDVKALFLHLQYMERKYHGVEYSLSFPRLKKIEGDENSYIYVSDTELLKIIAVSRILFPRVGINLSTRETAIFRDVAILAGVTKISAGSNTSVGGYGSETDANGQFAVSDTRSPALIKAMLKDKGVDPIITDWRAIENN